MEHKILINLFITALRVITWVQIFLFIKNYITEKIGIREDVYNQLIRKKEQEKDWYNEEVKVQYYKHNNCIFLKILSQYLGKLKKQCCKSFIIDGFGRDYNFLYIQRTFDQKQAQHTYYNNHLCIFCY